MNKYVERLYNGLIKENPTMVLMLGMCPTLAVSTAAINGVSMGLSTMAVLIFSNLIISILRKRIPNEVRLPAYIVIVASLVQVSFHSSFPELTDRSRRCMQESSYQSHPGSHRLSVQDIQPLLPHIRSLLFCRDAGMSLKPAHT